MPSSAHLRTAIQMRFAGAYHRGAHWAERVRMAQWWSDYLDDLRTGGRVISLTPESLNAQACVLADIPKH